jgi:type IV pilus assembly protein PilM
MANIIVTGIDIGITMVTAVILEMRGDIPKIRAVESFMHNRHILADHEEVNHQESVKKLKKVRDKQPLFQHRVALAIPDVMVMNKRVVIDPRLPLEQRSMAAMHSFASNSPFEIEELCFDYVNKPNEIDVYAARKHGVHQRVTLVEQAGMRPILVDIEQQAIFALLEMAKKKTPERHPLLIELKDRSLTFAAIDDERIFYRHIPTNMSSSVMTVSAIIKQEIERLKSQEELPKFTNVWIIGQLEHDDLITKKISISDACVDAYPLGDYFNVKRSLQPQSLYCYAKACGIALRGVVALEQHYAA